MADHHSKMLTEAMEMERPKLSIVTDDTPKDGFGAGFLVYRIAADFHALCCMTGPEAARQELAEIINSEFERKSRG